MELLVQALRIFPLVLLLPSSLLRLDLLLASFISMPPLEKGIPFILPINSVILGTLWMIAHAPMVVHNAYRRMMATAFPLVSVAGCPIWICGSPPWMNWICIPMLILHLMLSGSLRLWMMKFSIMLWSLTLVISLLYLVGRFLRIHQR